MDRARCLHEVFEATVDRHPDHLALSCRNVEWTYADLDRRANRLAYHLRTLGVGPGELVGITLERSEHPIVAMHAVLKAGAGYVPILPDTPPERRRHVTEEAGLRTLVTDREAAPESFTGNVVLLDGDTQAIDASPARRLTPMSSPAFS